MLFLRLIGLLALFFLSDLAFGRGGLQQLDLELKRMPFQRDYFYPEQLKWGHEVSLKLRYDKSVFLFESDITGQTFNDRFHNVWWDYTVGVKLFWGFHAIWDHRSQHALDLERKRFPVKDSYGIRWNLID